MHNLEITREANFVKREGFNNTEISRESLVSSRKFDKLTSLGINFGQSPYNELTSNYSRLTTSQDNPAHSALNELATSDYLLTTKRTAFTMAEILLSLTIIGVVAAITLPSLTGNINERTWNTQRKALYARMSQALPLMGALNGFGSYTAPTGTEGTASYNAGVDNVAETFITSGLSKVLKINNICSDNLQDCGFPAKITPLGGGAAINTPTNVTSLNNELITHGNGTWKNTKAAAFETANGESFVVHYNPKCIGSLGEKPFTEASSGGGIYVNKRICANFIYDLNGTKGPNTVGKDIGFMTVMYPFDAILYAPYPTPKRLSTNHTRQSATQACTNYDPEYRLPSANELLSMHANKLLIGAEDENSTYGYVSSDFWIKTSGKYTVSQSILTSFQDDMSLNWQGHVWCVKR